MLLLLLLCNDIGPLELLTCWPAGKDLGPLDDEKGPEKKTSIDDHAQKDSNFKETKIGAMLEKFRSFYFLQFIQNYIVHSNQCYELNDFVVIYFRRENSNI